jgi:hypothetical protein
MWIIDDVYFDPHDKTKLEIWKTVFAGQRTAIREAFTNIPFPGNMPVIICTNNKQNFIYWTKNPLFKHDATFIDLQEYIGPANTNKRQDSLGLGDSNKNIHIGSRLKEYYEKYDLEEFEGRPNKKRKQELDALDTINETITKLMLTQHQQHQQLQQHHQQQPHQHQENDHQS